MSNRFCYIVLLIGMLGFAQNNPNTTLDLNDIIVAQDSVSRIYDANRPAKAAFYSAVIPGLGQAYNKKYWKVPLALAAVGIPIYIYTVNDKEYQRLRDAFRIRLAGGTNDEFSNPDGTPFISTEGLERAQKTSQRNKELSILITAALYVLQIIDANVNGHLSQFNVDRNLTFLPFADYNTLAIGNTYGFNLNYTF